MQWGPQKHRVESSSFEQVTETSCVPRDSDGPVTTNNIVLVNGVPASSAKQPGSAQLHGTGILLTIFISHTR